MIHDAHEAIPDAPRKPRASGDDPNSTEKIAAYLL